MIIVLLWAMLAVPCAAERHALRVHARRGGER